MNNDEFYSVVLWDTQEVIARYRKQDYAAAKKAAREQGFDRNLISGNLKTFAPMAYVADGRGYCVYNPRFTVKAHGD